MPTAHAPMSERFGSTAAATTPVLHCCKQIGILHMLFYNIPGSVVHVLYCHPQSVDLLPLNTPPQAPCH